MPAIQAADWPSLVDDFSYSMKLVHQAMQQGTVEMGELANEFFQAMVAEYEQQIAEELAVLGCNRSVKLTNADILNELEAQARSIAAGMVETYNRDLAYAIQSIEAEASGAGFAVYGDKLAEWEYARSEWKSQQMAQMASVTGKNYGITESVQRNQLKAEAYVGGPDPAAEEECQALIDGQPYDAANLPAEFPLHGNCVHYWDIRDVETDLDCTDLWTGD